MTVRIIRDVQDAIAREIRQISFNSLINKTETSFVESFDIETGDLITHPLEPSLYSDTTHAEHIEYPQFFIQLLNIEEDLTSGRNLPFVGDEFIEPTGCTDFLVGGTKPRAFDIVMSDRDALTTDGGTGSTVTFTHRKMKLISDNPTNFIIRLVSGNNQGTYNIASASLTGNGPIILTLSGTLVSNAPTLTYDSATGDIVFRSFVDLTAVLAGDTFTDNSAAPFTISAVNSPALTITITTGETVDVSSGGSITRTGDVLTQDDSGLPISYLILDPGSPVVRNGSQLTEGFTRRSWAVPYNFYYLVEITNKEQDDHISIANSLLTVMHPARGTLNTITRTIDSAETTLSASITSGNSIITVTSTTGFAVNDPVRLADDLSVGETNVIVAVDSINTTITLQNNLANGFSTDNNAFIVSHSELFPLERDFRDHETADDVGDQFLVHRFNYKIYAWLDPKKAASQLTSSGPVHYINGQIKDISNTNSIGPDIEVSRHGTEG